MSFINPKTIFTISKKELLDNIRNRWIILLTVIFIILIITFSYVAGGGREDLFGDMEASVTTMMAISSLLIPLIAIILGFSTISGEAESGALYVVLSYPVRRIEVLLGKLLGLGSVIIISILLGFGFGGIVIALTTGSSSWTGYIGFIFLSIFLGFIYLSLAMCISSYCKRRITSIGGGIVLFFWSLIYGTVMMAVLFASGQPINSILTGDLPEWFINSAVFSPSDMHQTAVYRAFGQSAVTFDAGGGGGITSIPIPEFLNLGNLLIAHFIWFIIPLVLAYFLFKRRDI